MVLAIPHSTRGLQPVDLKSEMCDNIDWGDSFKICDLGAREIICNYFKLTVAFGCGIGDNGYHD